MKAKIILLGILCYLFSLTTSAQNATFDKVSIGTQNGTFGSSVRLSLIPPKHTNAWFFNTRDTSTDAYLDVLYGDNDQTNMLQQITFKWNTGIGIGTNNPMYKLDVNGTIRAKEIIVETGWADFVFAKDYKLPSLNEVKAHIDEHKHLPGIPSETEVKENGVSIADVTTKMMQKIEELTLYAIQQNDKVAEQQKLIEQLNKRLGELENDKK